jgi:predicted ATP-grasp superfamily ATP-dependent carboligase
MTRSVLVLGNYQQTLAILRSLARGGYRVFVGRSGGCRFTEFSRHVSGTWTHPDVRDKRNFLRALGERLGMEPEIHYVFPVGDSDLDAIADAYAELSRRCRLVMVEPRVLRACQEKPTMHDLAARVGVPVPESRLIADDPGALDAAVAEIGLPVLAKRPNSFSLMGERKAVVCRDPSTVEPLRSALRAGPVLVQRWVRGPRHNCQIAALGGELIAYFENRNLRTDRPDGTGFGVEWVSVEPTLELRRHCEALVRAVDYTGVGLLQFLVEEGRPYFLELNPRLGMPWELSLRCGLDFATLAVRCADKLRDPAAALPAVPGDYAVGKRCHWLLGDLVALAVAARGTLELLRRLAATIASWLRADFHLAWSWGDPLPTLYLYACFAKGRLSRWVG